jgi:hypothetical protein
LALDIFLSKIFNIALDKLECVSLFSNLPNFKVSSIFVTIKDVILNRYIEKKRLLHDETYLFSKFANVIISDINTVDLQTSTSDIVEPEEKIGNGTFTATRVTNKCDFLCSGYGQVKLFKHPLILGRILKVNVF